MRSLKNNKFYVGSTTDINERLRRHKAGNVKATKCLLPIKLELFQEYDDFSSARKIEASLKKLKRRDFIEKIVRDKVIKMGP